ncbi:MAG: hypothetical protein AVDCRST_MAG73-750 [uncultured Thermomicrobiales bacterium]|uniref:Uncharacterized protein n=1 Tax=uncultured Thermomicrobiales bacterium TaxID=1645740 RepID=A0A6J4TQ00_9BACT|nr:MAG: hypothetical protein AVDCRST_MAG73-750 [uncultured Thermomicrobiales bacterium]
MGGWRGIERWLAPIAPGPDPAAVLTVCDDDGATARRLERAGFRATRLVAGVGYHQRSGQIGTGGPPTLRAAATALPFPNGAFDAVLLLDVLEHVVDDPTTLAETARVLRPGGRLVVRVPQAGPLAWLDSLNAYRYLRDISRRGKRPRETAKIGWHRHYAAAELTRMLEQAGFRVEATTGTGTGLSEALNLALLLRFRWLVFDRQGYDRARRWYARALGVDQRLGLGPWGRWVTAIATKDP